MADGAAAAAVDAPRPVRVSLGGHPAPVPLGGAYLPATGHHRPCRVSDSFLSVQRSHQPAEPQAPVIYTSGEARRNTVSGPPLKRSPNAPQAAPPEADPLSLPSFLPGPHPRSCSVPLSVPPTALLASSSARVATDGRSARARTVSPKPAAALRGGAFPPPRRHDKPLPHFSQVADPLPPACYPKSALKADEDDLPPALPTAPITIPCGDGPVCAGRAPQSRFQRFQRSCLDEWPAPRRPDECDWPEPRRAAILLPRSVSPSTPPPASGPFPQAMPLSRCPSADRATLHDRLLSVRNETSAVLPEAVWEHILRAVDTIPDDDIVYHWHHVVAGQNAVLEVGKRVEEVHILIDGAMCSICLDPIQRNLRGLRLPCGHLFHGCCIMTWLRSRTRCPNCNYDLLQNSWSRRS